MSISTHFGEAPQWAQTHFGGVELGDVRRSQRVVTLAAGWAREPGARIPRLSQGKAYASKATCQLLGHAQTTPDALQAPHRRHVATQLQAPGTYLLVEDTTELSWPEAAERRAGLGPVGPGKATSQGVLLHSLVAVAGKTPAGRLFEQARAQPSAGPFSLALRGRPRQPARDVVLQVSFSAPLALRAPQRPGEVTGKGEPVPASVVRVWEETGPGAAPGLEWLLLCDQPVVDFAQALCCVRQYTSRWLIEDFHKALKTGLGAERLQLQTAARLFAAVALLSVVALALVDLREKSRLEPNLPAEAAGLTTTELRVLRHQSRRPWPPSATCTWPWPGWAGIWDATAMARLAGSPSGSADAASGCSWKASTWPPNCSTANA